jgi:alpha-L-fucosidase
MKKYLILLALGLAQLDAQNPDSTPADATWPKADAAALAHWQSLRYGMFIHWGPVSLTEKEIGWSRGSQTPVDVYDNLYHQFNPVKFNAAEWVGIAKAAGMKYIVLTTKHHDGFCLWDTKFTDYNIMNTPFKRDVVKELSDACKKEGIAFGAYYSVCDWHHPDFPLTSPGGKTKREKSDLDAYNQYLLNQTRELVTHYGPLLTIWNDVPQMFKGRGTNTIQLIRSLQPDILINNRSGDGGDYDTPEQRIGGFNLARPWESCMTISAHNHWAWGGARDGVKPLAACLQLVAGCAGGDGNMLMNVGPRPDGVIDPEQAARLQEIGTWLQKYGESIYGTRGGPYHPTRSYAATRRGHIVYLHLFKGKGDTFTLPPFNGEILESSLLTGGPVSVQNDREALTIKVAPADQQSADTVVKLVVKGEALELAPIKPVIQVRATASNVRRNSPAQTAEMAVDEDSGTRWATDDGTTQAWLEVDFSVPRTIQSLTIEEGTAPRVKKFALEYDSKGEWKTLFTGTSLGGTIDRFHQTFNPVTTHRVRLNILEATDGPSIAEIQFGETGTKP